MPYIAFDLDALKHVPDAARAASIRESDLGYGLVRLWAYCWTEKTEFVTSTHLVGFFGADVSAALVAFGHLEAQAERFRVRGADRYLRLHAGQTKGGLASKGNLVPGGKKPKRSRARAELEPSQSLETGLGSTSGLTPSTEHRAPSTESLKPAPAPRTPRETDDVCRVFFEVTGAKYVWQGEKDSTAFKRLRAHASVEEICSRWRKALSLVGWKQAASVAQLASKWNDLAVGDTDVRKAPLDGELGTGPNTGTVKWG